MPGDPTDPFRGSALAVGSWPYTTMPSKVDTRPTKALCRFSFLDPSSLMWPTLLWVVSLLAASTAFLAGTSIGHHSTGSFFVVGLLTESSRSSLLPRDEAAFETVAQLQDLTRAPMVGLDMVMVISAVYLVSSWSLLRSSIRQA
jgi:hypothetical protein